MEYHVLTDEQQYQIVEGKVRQYEQNLLTAIVDQAAAAASGEDSQANTLATQIVKWGQARDAASKILDGMKKPVEKPATDITTRVKSPPRGRIPSAPGVPGI